MKKTLKRFLTTVLTTAMVLGMFVGSEMKVLAANHEWDHHSGGVEIQAGDTFTFPDEYRYRNVKYYSNDERIIRTDDGVDVIYSVDSIDGITTWVIWYVRIYGGSDSYLGFDLCLKEKVSTPTTPFSDAEVKHEHVYSWTTVQEVSAGQDGIEEYRCSCGDVAERSMIPASQVFVKGLYGEIKNAPQNGLVQFDSGRLYTMSDYIIRKLAERNDVTTVVTFEYERKIYKMTIPAGLDYTTILADTDRFYGYFYFAKLVGATIEAV